MEAMLPFIGMGAGVLALAGVALFGRLRAGAERTTGVTPVAPAREAAARTKGAAPETPAVKAQRTPAPAARSPAVLNGLMPIVLSLLVLLSALYVVLFAGSYSDAQQKWAFGAIGTLLGYWLKK